MTKYSQNVGMELVLLLKQQRNLYHQLKVLTDKQIQIISSNSPELLLKIMAGRRKLIEKLRELEAKLQLINSSWPKISAQIGSEHKQEAREMLGEVQQIVREISAKANSGLEGKLSLNEAERLDELLVQQEQ